MPKASRSVSEETEMLVLAQAVKSTTKKSGRVVSTSVVVAAATAGVSKHSANVKKGKSKTENAAEGASTNESTSNPKKSRETIQATLDTLEEDTMHQSWRDVLGSEFSKPYFKKVLLPASLDLVRVSEILWSSSNSS
jgi:hypothetical protein